MTNQNSEVISRVEGRGMIPVLPKGVFLLLDEMDRETMSPGGIILLPETTGDEATRQATVVSVGKDVQLVKKKDRVLVGKYYGQQIPHDDDEVCKLILVTEDQIEALIE